jgi:hypothetical protein
MGRDPMSNGAGGRALPVLAAAGLLIALPSLLAFGAEPIPIKQSSISSIGSPSARP